MPFIWNCQTRRWVILKSLVWPSNADSGALIICHSSDLSHLEQLEIEILSAKYLYNTTTISMKVRGLPTRSFLQLSESSLAPDWLTHLLPKSNPLFLSKGCWQVVQSDKGSWILPEPYLVPRHQVRKALGWDIGIVLAQETDNYDAILPKSMVSELREQTVYLSLPEKNLCPEEHLYIDSNKIEHLRVHIDPSKMIEIHDSYTYGRQEIPVYLVNNDTKPEQFGLVNVEPLQHRIVLRNTPCYCFAYIQNYSLNLIPGIYVYPDQIAWRYRYNKAEREHLKRLRQDPRLPPQAQRWNLQTLEQYLAMLDQGYVPFPAFKLGRCLLPCDDQAIESYYKSGGQCYPISSGISLFKPVPLLEAGLVTPDTHQILNAALALNVARNAHKPLLQILAEQLGLSNTELALLFGNLAGSS